MDPHTLRDCLSVTGVDSPGKSIAAGPNGQLIFKKSASQLYYCDVHEMSSYTLRLSRMDPLYQDCQIYDLAFCRRGSLLICLQRVATGEFFICEGTIDCDAFVVEITGPVHKTNIAVAKGKNVVLIRDEAGVVLLSYPIRWQSSPTTGNVIELFHVSNFLSSSAGDKYTISLQSREIFDATFASPFISRNHLYLFYGHDYSRFMLVPLTGPSCGKCELRRTQGSPPPDDYMSKTVQCFEEFALIYANQNVRSTRPNFYLLNLTNLTWLPLNLMLSHHFPNGKISLQKCGEEVVYLHGDCNLTNCVERTHLYQIDVEPLSALIHQKRRSRSLTSLSASEYSLADKRSIAVPGSATASTDASTSSSPSAAKTTTHTPPRFQKKSETKRRHSNGKGSMSSMTSQDGLAETQPLKRTNSSSSLHWSADMAEQATLSLQSQLKLAKDMGYQEDVLLAALATQEKDKEGLYLPFESTNAMLDILNSASVRENSSQPRDSSAISLNDPRTNRSPLKNVRSSSFHAGSPSSSPRSEQLSRLLRTFERERIRDREVADTQMARLKARIHDLERVNDHHQMTERDIRDRLHELQRRNDTLAVEHKKSEREKEQLKQTVVELQTLTDRLTLENLRNEHQAKDQKELAEHRKKQYDQQISALEESIRTLTERCNALAADIKEKDRQLLEKSKRIQEFEDRNSQLQPEALLEKIMTEYQLKRKEEEKRREANEIFNRKITKYHEQLLASFPRLEEQRRRLETEKERATEECEQLRREMSRLREKTCAECCICLATKPCVLFLPCRHMVICDTCHAESTITECPTCRTHVGDSMKVFS
ncbi:RING-type domain-containing protein [Trichostrongylus colubriformis]|uniref:RING-type domain-containing protein n=1 Tax=Trichostrongylus colubriformis TaxID=6319 RepID=A0AAN8FG19_TRICO